jgi:hypothetical protein
MAAEDPRSVASRSSIPHRSTDSGLTVLIGESIRVGDTNPVTGLIVHDEVHSPAMCPVTMFSRFHRLIKAIVTTSAPTADRRKVEVRRNVIARVVRDGVCTVARLGGGFGECGGAVPGR